MKVKDILKGVLEHAAPTEVLPNDAEWYFKMGISLLQPHTKKKKTKRLGRPAKTTKTKGVRGPYKKRTTEELAKTTQLRREKKAKQAAKPKTKSYTVTPKVLAGLAKARAKMAEKRAKLRAAERHAK